MKRRHVLRASGAGVTAAAVGLAGCGGFLGGLEVASVESRTTALGNVEVSVVVENTSGSSQTGELVTQVDVEGGDTYTERQEVTVPGNAENSYAVTHDLSLSESLTADSYEYNASIE